MAVNGSSQSVHITGTVSTTALSLTDFGFDPTDGPDVITSAEEDWDEPVLNIDGVDYYFGSIFWAGPIELPELNGEQLQPDSF